MAADPTSLIYDATEIARENDAFRREIVTGAESQVVVMTTPPGGEIGEEVHEGRVPGSDLRTCPGVRPRDMSNRAKSPAVGGSVGWPVRQTSRESSARTRRGR